MLSIIGSDNFSIKRSGTITSSDSWERQLNQYILESRNGNTEEYMYFDEAQVNELINLLQKVKEVL
ncbi:hypothetical protein [Halalkalibacter oceani]|uniref:hypothetical protein n=1 Tax=Halalkalibacter oceani TaxID=1653776 RepID=UPI003392D54B